MQRASHHLSSKRLQRTSCQCVSPLRVPAEVTALSKHSGSVIVAVTTLCQVTPLQSFSHDTESTPKAIRHVSHIMLFSFSFRWSPRCRQHACRSHRVCHLSPRSVKVSRLIHVNIGPVRSVSDGPDSMRVSNAPISVWSYRLSFLDAVHVQPCL